MERFINNNGKECFRGATIDTPFDVGLFHQVLPQLDEDVQFALFTDIGAITVLDRLTGYYGYVRDTETGYRDMDGKFWLASGMCDVRESGAKTLGEAIVWIKSKANTCNPDRNENDC